MKCAAAVRIGLARPGKASPALGMATFLKPNMLGPPAIADRNICRTAACRNGLPITSWQEVGFRGSRAREATHCRSRPCVADQRLLLAAEHKEENAEKAEEAPAWRRQNAHRQ